MKIVLCSASEREIYRIIKHFKANLLLSVKNKHKIYHYNNQKDEIYFIITGMGCKNVKKNLDYFIKKYNIDNKFLWILTGYAGSVTGNLNIADIFIPAVIRNKESVYRIDSDRFIKLKKHLVLFEVNRIYSEKEKRELKKRYPDIGVVDMESAAFCDVMNKNDFTDYFIYKSITDDLIFKFPDFRLLRDSVFKIKFKDLFSVLIKDISQLKYLIAIYKNMSLASKNIYKFFIKFYEKSKD